MNARFFLKGDDEVTFIIKDDVNNHFTVTFQTSSEMIECTCLKYMKVGIPCRHIFTALKSLGKERIPNCLLLPRWMKGATRKVCGPELNDVLKSVVLQERNKSMAAEIWSKMICCIGSAQDDGSKMKALLDRVNEIEGEFTLGDTVLGTCRSSLEGMVESFAGIC